jgi:hypothetical protein
MIGKPYPGATRCGGFDKNISQAFYKLITAEN